MKKIVVVGGGSAGTMSAYTLKKLFPEMIFIDKRRCILKDDVYWNTFLVKKRIYRKSDWRDGPC